MKSIKAMKALAKAKNWHIGRMLMVLAAPPQGNESHYGDFLPDSAESNYGCSTSNKDTHNVSGARDNIVYLGYGDGEYAVMVDSRGATGNASADWSKGGKQW